MVDKNKLKDVPFFKDLTQDELSSVSAIVNHKDFKEGDKVFEEGDKGEELYIIKTGANTYKVKNRIYKINGKNYQKVWK